MDVGRRTLYTVHTSTSVSRTHTRTSSENRRSKGTSTLYSYNIGRDALRVLEYGRRAAGVLHQAEPG